MNRCLSCLLLALFVGCRNDMAQSNASSPKRDINAVLAEHDKQLMAIPNVVGVYVGTLDDGKTPCLKVMLARTSPETEKAIPHMLEGYPVTTEVTGEIHPLGHP